MIDITKIYTSNKCGDFKITKYVNSTEVHIQFLLTGYRSIAESTPIRKGRVKDKLYPNVCGVGFVGEGAHKTSRKSTSTKPYYIWSAMIRRCYSLKAQKKQTAYINVTVCDEWHNFQNFAKWFEVNYAEGLHLDKDIKQNGVKNKIYSPEVCKFVTQSENNIQATARNYTMMDPHGEVREIYNMAEFCRENDLNHNLMRCVRRGEFRHHKGWTKA